jgi:hypothetical protein
MSQVAYQQSKLRQQKLLQQQQQLHKQQVEDPDTEGGEQAFANEAYYIDELEYHDETTEDESGSEDVIGSYIQEFLDLYPSDKVLPFLEDGMEGLSFDEESYSFYDEDVSDEEGDIYDDYDYDDDGEFYFNDSDFDGREYGFYEENGEGRGIAATNYTSSGVEFDNCYLDNCNECDGNWAYPQHMQTPVDPWMPSTPASGSQKLPPLPSTTAVPAQPATKPRSTSAPVPPVINGEREKSMSTPTKKAAANNTQTSVASSKTFGTAGTARPVASNAGIAANNKVENSSSTKAVAAPIASKAPVKGVTTTTSTKTTSKPNNKGVSTTTTTTKTLSTPTKTISTKSTTTIASVPNSGNRSGPAVSMAKMTFTATATTTTRSGKGVIKSVATGQVRPEVRPSGPIPPLLEAAKHQEVPEIVEVGKQETKDTKPEDVAFEGGETASKKKRRRRKKKGGAGTPAGEIDEPVAAPSKVVAPKAPSEPNKAQCAVKDVGRGKVVVKTASPVAKLVSGRSGIPMGAVITELVARGKAPGKGSKKEGWPELDRLDDSGENEEFGRGKKNKKPVSKKVL